MSEPTPCPVQGGCTEISLIKRTLGINGNASILDDDKNTIIGILRRSQRAQRDIKIIMVTIVAVLLTISYYLRQKDAAEINGIAKEIGLIADSIKYGVSGAALGPTGKRP